MNGRVIVGLSGGVDSAVAAALLQRQGVEVEGLFMRNWAEDDAYCSAAEDLQAARSVAEVLGISLHTADFSREYKDKVFAGFLQDYTQGRTPSPDLLCNREIKFGEFARHAQALGADAIATGHYAGVKHEAGSGRLYTAADPNKDQTYFLAATPGQALARAYFPLGALQKPAVRALAAELGLPNHQRKDSTGVCFIGERPMRQFLQNWIPAQPGAIVDDGGRELGQHQGVAYYTLGQREGLGIGGVAGAREAPWYVAERRVESNELVVSQDRQDPRLLSRRLVLGQCYWVNEPPAPGACELRIRHRQKLQAAQLLDAHPITLETARPQWAAATGQYAVIYRENECLGCGVIELAEP